MNVVGIKELQADMTKLNHLFEQDNYTLITRQGEAVGITLPFNNELMQSGLKAWMAIKAFENGDLSLGQLAIVLGKTKWDILSILSQFKIPIADYDLQEDLDTIEKLNVL